MRRTRIVTIALVIACVAPGAACVITWSLPDSFEKGRWRYSKLTEDELGIPQILLSEATTAGLALNCAKLANSFATSSSQNRAWSLIFGGFQAVGAAVAATAGSAAFSDPNDGKDTSKRIAAVALAIATVATALDKAKDPAKSSESEAESAFKIGALIHQAAYEMLRAPPSVHSVPAASAKAAAVKGKPLKAQVDGGSSADGGARDEGSATPDEGAVRAALTLNKCQDPKDLKAFGNRNDLLKMLEELRDANKVLKEISAKVNADGGAGN